MLPENPTFKDIIYESYNNATEHGFHPVDQTQDQFIESTCNNIHNEISELHEHWRNNQLFSLCDKTEKIKMLGLEPLTNLEEELADIMIRVMDTAVHLGIDIQKSIITKQIYNRSRPFRHGGKKS